MSSTDILFVHALTGLHPGSGTALGVVDLPIQRERHTQWPTIPGSALKGVLRASFQSRLNGNDEDKKRLYAVFGPDTENASDHAGAVAFTDARILAFPVRSLRGVFAWVTCPDVLIRLNRDLRLAGLDPVDVPELGENEAACAAESPLLLNDGKLVLEEFEFTRTMEAGSFPGWLADRMGEDGERLGTHTVVIDNDGFTHFVRHATEVLARIGLDYATKTVKKGALFYEEYLPAETLLYSLVIAEDSRNGKKKPDEVVIKMKSDEVLRYVASAPSYLQFGAGETIGKGLCNVRFANGKGN